MRIAWCVVLLAGCAGAGPTVAPTVTALCEYAQGLGAEIAAGFELVEAVQAGEMEAIEAARAAQVRFNGLPDAPAGGEGALEAAQATLAIEMVFLAGVATESASEEQAARYLENLGWLKAEVERACGVR